MFIIMEFQIAYRLHSFPKTSESSVILLLTVPEKIHKVRKDICMRNIHCYNIVADWCYVRDLGHINNTVGF